ncbi:hybrid sensor histidine kinase/response regulator (plasmid) [Azospirillum baldaniorum]|uniref:hybrid sensor histidine kinase/response regulator n=1 Tax=Azospirillum baldaniorum TaxID=1064539 RepID=UPI000D60041C|nr:response regulator [Azospirillum baldaniorum]AWJ92022.1 hybrid sensor histidine kinase/response regulator [Azospirillum baldaniorum]TWA73790.1 two-component system chemotaxis sensor kinase CheA [Azospirillum brasilense]
MNDIRARLLAAFDLEHKEHLAAIREALRAVEKDPAHHPDLVEIHRRAHSLKGAARAVDLPEVERLSHWLEAAFIAIQRGTVPFDAAARDVVRRALDAIEDVVAWATRGGGEVDIAEVLAELTRMGGEGGGPEPVQRRPSPGASPAAPAADAARDAAPTAAPRRAQTAGPAENAALVRIRATGLERLFTAAAGLLPEIENQSALVAELRELRGEWRALERSWHAMRPRLLRGSHDAAGSGATSFAGDETALRLSSFDRRFRALGASLDAAHRAHDRHLWSLRRWGSGFQDEVRQLRMLPAESQFSNLGRMIRDISRAQGKEVEADIRGLETQADRVVLQRLKDPVLHIARNAVSHGVETPQERVAAGKRAAATVRFEASVVGRRLVLRIEDDGRGPNRAAIARHAVERGLLGADEAEAAPEERLLDLIFEPGFSTAPTANEYAGRGMGLAIVRREVTRLQGSVTLAAREGGGTVVTVEVPLSLLSQRLVFVAVQDDILAIPSNDVARVLRVPADTLFTDLAAPTIRLEEDVPVTPLSALLGYDGAMPQGNGAPLALVILRTAGRRVALVVDALMATRDSVVTPAEEVGIDAARFLGTVLMDDGSPALVLNPAALSPRPGMALPPLVRPVDESERRRPHILVVDDSITTRTLEKSILEAHGYRVTLCVDGREAVETLGELEDVNLIISDVEMPRMDGFALLQAVKGNPMTSDLPVILVTSRASDEDRERGLDLGADAYIVKTRFDQNELLAGIRRLL